MTSAPTQHPEITRTERGLTIAGTRITLYDVIDHLKAGWVPQQILNWLPVTEEQLSAVLSYVDAHRTEVEAEYITVSQEAQERRKYWQEKYQERLDQIAKLPPKPGQEELYAKLQAWKSRLGLIV